MKHVKHELVNIDVWAAVMRPRSPGNFLRLLHGLRHRFVGRRMALIANEPARQLGFGLWSGNRVPVRAFHGGEVDVYEEQGNLVWLQLNALKPDGSEFTASDMHAAWKAAFGRRKFAYGASIAWTSYSNQRLRKSPQTRDGCLFRRIDRKKHCPLFPRIAFQSPLAAADRRLTPVEALCVLRHNGVDPWRYSPSYHLRNEITLNGTRVKVTFAGLGHYPPDLIRTIPLMPNGDLVSYLDQLANLRQFDFAFGVNSSALDLASAAGVPVVRECEFQSIKRSQNWPFSAGYNTFLGVVPNVGLGIRNEHDGTTKWHDEGRLLRALGSLHANWAHIRSLRAPPASPRHRVFTSEDRRIERDEVDAWLRSIL